MPLITDDDKAKREVQELSKAWCKLRLIPEYVRDYELSLKSGLAPEEEQRIKETWGFCPLSDPEGDISFDFQYAFSGYDEKVYLNNSPLDWNGLHNYSVNDGKLYNPEGSFVRELKDLNLKIKLEVDLT